MRVRPVLIAVLALAFVAPAVFAADTPSQKEAAIRQLKSKGFTWDEERREIRVATAIGTECRSLDEILGPIRELKAESLDLSRSHCVPDLRALRNAPTIRQLVFYPNVVLVADTLRQLREIGRLHLLPTAEALDGSRPRTDDEIHSLSLDGPAGDIELKEFQGLKNLTVLGMNSPKNPDSCLVLLEGFKKLKELGLFTTKLGPKGRGALKQLVGLEALRFVSINITDDDLKELVNHKMLRVLMLSSTEVSDNGLRHLSAFKNLTSLTLYSEKANKVAGQGFTEAGLKCLKDLVQLKSLTLNHLDIGDAGLKELGGLKNLTELNLVGTKLTNEGIKELRGLTSLTTLSLSNTSIDNAGMESLRPLSRLTKLHLAGTKVTRLNRLSGSTQLSDLDLSSAAAVDDLRVFKKLTTLTLYNCATGDLAALGDLKNLEKLYLDHQFLSDSTLQSLRRAKVLRPWARADNTHFWQQHPRPVPNTLAEVTKLWLNGTKITDAGLKELVDFPNLTELDLTGSKVTGRGLKSLTQFKQLRTLNVGYTAVTDDGLEDLKNLHHLTSLDLDGCRVTEAGLRKLKDVRDLERLRFGLPWDRPGGRPPLVPGAFRALKDCRNLTHISFGSHVMTDDLLRSANELGLLPALSIAQLDASDRPRRPDEITTLNLSGSSVTDIGLQELKGLTNLTCLNLSLSKISNNCTKTLGGLPGLISLDLGSTPVNGKALRDLARMKNLSQVRMNRSGITDTDVLALREAGKLHLLSDGYAPPRSPSAVDDVVGLDLSDSALTSVGLQEVACFRNLENLNLSKSAVTDTDLRIVKQLGKLEELDLSDTAVSDTGLEAIQGLDKITSLNLSGTKITDAGMKKLKKYRNLSSLKLENTTVTDAGLLELSGIPRLTDLGLSDTAITDGRLKTLRQLGLLHILGEATPPDATLFAWQGDPKDDPSRPRRPSDIRVLNLSQSKITAAGLKELKDFKGLTDLSLPRSVYTDEGLKTLREIGLLHTVDRASANDVSPPGDGRPRSPTEVTTFRWDLTTATDAGLKELREFTHLRHIDIEREKITDGTLASLREIGLIHALAVTDDHGEGPRTANDATAFEFTNTKVTSRGLRELKGLKNLNLVTLESELYTDETLKVLHEIGKLNAWPGAESSDGGRPNSQDAITAFKFPDSKVTSAGLKELKDLSHLKRLDLSFVALDKKWLAELAGFKQITSLSVAHTNIGEFGLKELARLTQLTELDLTDTRITDEDIKDLKPSSNLTTLVLTNTGISDDGMKVLKAFRKLTALDLTDTFVSDLGLKELGEFTGLLSLKLSGSRFTHAGLKELAGLKTLEVLSLCRTSVTDAGLKELKGLQHLTTLELDTTNVTGTGLRELAGRENLTILDLSRTSVTDTGLRELMGLKNLKRLDLSETKVTDAGLKTLQGLSQLEYLGLHGTKTSDEAEEKLKKVLPRCEIGHLRPR
ncbi:Alanyl-tRNA synthetase [Fimbriiglobus ruber]|uniref:Alanyl-tRNA synthetase n=1 Tax=Fimbriiglobus ruber TaxID=1908690 RepID=A0A225DLB5_9BACT|nr:Alanyl-tRNA synthetase [Fimbriiglobus ruber]